MIMVLLLTALFLISPVVHADAIGVEVGKEAPDFTLGTVDGEAFVSLSGHRGKVVVLIYWRSDQERSQLALKDCQEIQSRYKGKGVGVISIVADTENMEDVRKMVKGKGIDFPVLADTGRRVYSTYGIRVYPSTIIVDREGKVAMTIPGHAVTYRNSLDGDVRYVLGEINEEQLQDALSPHRTERDRNEVEAERKYNLAIKFTESGLIEQAVGVAREAADAQPDSVRLRILLGFLYLEMKDADKAEAEFRKALDLEPSSHDARTGLGGAMVLKGDIDGAIEILEQAAKINPNPQVAYYELGSAYEMKGEQGKAMEMYKRSLEKIFKKQILPYTVLPCR